MNAPDYHQSHIPDGADILQPPGAGFFDSVLKPLATHIADQIDAGLQVGTIEAHMPDGSVRMAGGRSDGPYAVIHIHRWRALTRLLRSGSIGFYEGWEAGEWQSPNPVQIFDLFMRNRVSLGNVARPSGVLRWLGKGLNWLKRNSRTGARKNIEFHYDLGNDFYAPWLDETMTYSSAIFSGEERCAETLAKAQNEKNDRLLTRLDLQTGDKLLEIGCGWGGFAQRVLEQYDISYHGITLSAEQQTLTAERLGNFGDRAKVTITDYRDIDEGFDAIASVEMVEAVGQQYWPNYLDVIVQNLKKGRHAAIQYIRIEDDVFDAYARGQDFIQRYIFPGGMLLSESRFRSLAEEKGLQWTEQRDFGIDYADTLKIWRERFDKAASKGQLPPKFDEKFIRLWRYYLMYCEGGFRGGGINVSQVTLTKK